VHIKIEDDGAGVDEEKLRLAAERAGLSGQLSLTDLLFTPFVSTANDVGDIAGRGVGMAAVRKELHDAGYEIEVTSRADEGTRIDILPRGAQRMPEKRASTQVA
jgi:chemotaxis protein histidine kinase CheA